MTILYEHRVGKIRHGTPKLLTSIGLEMCRGFRSVYGWPEEAVAHILQTRSTAGLKYFAVYADDLLLDFDNNQAAADAAQAWLLANNITHTMWDSGGRSVHFHIKIQPMLGRMVPASHKKFVAATFPGADLSFYHAAGMYRLPFTAHEKNPGRYKEMTGHLYKYTLDIPLLPETPIFAAAAVLDIDDRAGTEQLLTYMMFKIVNEGDGRNHHAYKLTKIAKDLGYDFETAMDIVETWSDSCAQPCLEPAELETTVRSAYRG